MGDKHEPIDGRTRGIRGEDGFTRGRDPENIDPEMLEGEDAEIARANKKLKRGEGEDANETGNPAMLRPGERLPPD